MQGLLFALFTSIMFGTQVSAIWYDETGIEALKKEEVSSISYFICIVTTIFRLVGWKNPSGNLCKQFSEGFLFLGFPLFLNFPPLESSTAT